MPKRKAKVLLVENYNDLREFQRELLTDHGFEVSEAKDGKAALEFLKRSPDYQPHVIILDLHMPRMNGEELAAELKTQDRFRCVPIVLHSSEIRLQDVAERMNVTELLVKPFTPKQFLDTVKKALARSRPYNPPVEQELRRKS